MSLIVEFKYAYKKVIGVDLGNGLIKVRSVYDDGTPYILTMPNAFVLKSSLGRGEAVSGLDLDYFEINGITYGWGKEIMSLPEILTTEGYENRYTGVPYKLMVKMVLAKAFDDLGIKAEDNVLIVTGVPSEETDTIAESQIKEAFKGTHDLSLNGKNMLFKIEDMIVMSQPVATVMGRYLNEYGKVGDARYESMKVAVIDIGGGTTDLDIVQNMRRLEGFKTIGHGFNQVYDAIREKIAETYPKANPTNFALLKILLKGENEEGRYLYSPSMRLKPVDFTDAFDNAIYELVVKIHGAITNSWKSQTDIDETLLVGGSADLFEEYISHVANFLVIPENNGDSNVDGYFKTGMMMSLKKAKESITN